MLIVDKQEDISTLQKLGASHQLIRMIFLFEGWLISILGAVIGVALGIAICYAQEVFGFVKLGASGNFIVQAYPVKVFFSDIFAILFVVLLVGFLTAYYPVRRISKKRLQ